MQIKLLKAVLNLFEGGAGAGGAGASAGEGGAANGENSTAPLTTGRNKGEYANVVFGKQESAPDAGEPEATEEPANPQQTEGDRANAYREFIEANKDLYQKDLDEKFAKKTAKRYELENKLKEQQTVIDMMLSRYGIQDGDLSKLNEAINNDEVYYERMADEQGLTIDQAKMIDNLQRQNNQLMRSERERIAAEEEEIRIRRAIQSAEEVKAMYPDFDLRNELENNEKFRAYIDQNKTPLEAYRLAHFEELMQAQVAQTEKAVTSNIRAKGSRPVENGTTSQSSFVVKNDVTKLNKADRAEIARRALRGERISF